MSDGVLWRNSDEISELSFTSSTRGWARTHFGDLFLTNDGGATWKDISPTPIPHATSSVTTGPKFKAKVVGPGLGRFERRAIYPAN